MLSEQEIYQKLQERFDEAVLDFAAEAAQPSIDVDPLRVHEVAAYLKDDGDLAFDRLLCLSGVDHEGYDEKGKGKHRAIAEYSENGKPTPVTDEATGDLGVVYHLESSRHGHRLCLKVRVSREEPRVESVGQSWTTALWGERETYDFYGIEFLNHPDLRRILLPEDWEGWPLRKDYEMPAIYHDVPLEGLPLAARDES
jgi:NADH-quinone oxidoreductase subunit C